MLSCSTKLAVDKAVLAEVERLGLALTEEELTEMRAHIQEGFNNNLEENQAFLNTIGFTREEWIEFALRQDVQRDANSKIIELPAGLC